ncbi:hypothetical protein M422DRAFT_99930, partial [Sphaerobolus stellatus SS14]
LLDLPLELLEWAISCIELPNDLLYLACTCRALSKLVIPHHLEYRHIRTDASNQTLWDHLASKPGLASRVHHLELRDFMLKDEHPWP